MCIIAYKPKGKTIPKDNLKRCYQSNPDGAGYMFAKDNQLIIRKPFFSFDSMLVAAESDGVLDGKYPCAFHFRIKTHGEIDKLNTHPHRVDENIGMVHNGIMTGFIVPASFKSDTVHFNEQVLQQLPEGWMHNQELVDTIKTKIGSTWNKIVILNADETVIIINESGGTWSEDCWYSNSGFMAYTNTHTCGRWWGDEFDDYMSNREWWAKQGRRVVPRNHAALLEEANRILTGATNAKSEEDEKSKTTNFDGMERTSLYTINCLRCGKDTDVLDINDDGFCKECENKQYVPTKQELLVGAP